jgi:hypothetical protein
MNWLSCIVNHIAGYSIAIEVGVNDVVVPIIFEHAVHTDEEISE